MRARRALKSCKQNLTGHSWESLEIKIPLAEGPANGVVLWGDELEEKHTELLIGKVRNKTPHGILSLNA